MHACMCKYFEKHNSNKLFSLLKCKVENVQTTQKHYPILSHGHILDLRIILYKQDNHKNKSLNMSQRETKTLVKFYNQLPPNHLKRKKAKYSMNLNFSNQLLLESTMQSLKKLQFQINKIVLFFMHKWIQHLQISILQQDYAKLTFNIQKLRGNNLNNEEVNFIFST